MEAILEMIILKFIVKFEDERSEKIAFYKFGNVKRS